MAVNAFYENVMVTETFLTAVALFVFEMGLRYKKIKITRAES